MNVDFSLDQLQFVPPLLPGTQVQIEMCLNNGNIRIESRCLTTGALMETRPDCQLLQDGAKRIVVAAPGSIKRPRLSWKVRLLRWLARG